MPLVLAITGYRSEILSDWWLEKRILPAALPLPLRPRIRSALQLRQRSPGEFANDRLVHFLFGLTITYPAYEAFLNLTRLRNWLRYFLPLQFILAASAVYEILEWLVTTPFVRRNVIDSHPVIDNRFRELHPP
jgi:hypothetical protein